MFHPFQEDPKELSDTQLQERISELTRKYHSASRLGSKDLLTQIQTFVIIYRDEVTRRAMTSKIRTDDDKDLDQLINVD